MRVKSLLYADAHMTWASNRRLLTLKKLTAADAIPILVEMAVTAAMAK